VNDKILHGIAGIFISLLFYLDFRDVMVSFAAAVLIGATKEVYDYFHGGTSELDDILATAVGGFIGCVAIAAGTWIIGG